MGGADQPVRCLCIRRAKARTASSRSECLGLIGTTIPISLSGVLVDRLITLC
jgi:hypothetical protein